MKGFVVGVSGGVDSALTSTLCSLTGKPVIALNMPILQDPEQYNLAAQHIEWLKKRFVNVSSFEVDLSDVFLCVQKSFPAEIRDARTMANTRSRIRMITLYAFATHYGYLVVGTGNKVEDFGVGFFTKYGDGGVDISPIADLMKSEVYMLAREMGIIPQILAAPPVDGLWVDNRTDEQQIGATYDELEWAMRWIKEKNKNRKVRITKRQREVLEIFQRFHKMNKHKMKPIPVCKIPEKLKKK